VTVAEHLRQALEEELGQPVTGLARAGGGCINDAYEVRLADGGRLFCKTHADPPPDFFAVEAQALAWLASAGAIGVPGVVAVRTERPSFLAVEWVEPAHADSDPIEHGLLDADHASTEERLGRELAALHAAGAPTFGWDRDGYIGELAQPNAPADDWAAFYRDRRILPLVRRAVDERLLPADAMPAVDRLSARLPELVGPPEPAARLHGDLWGGNLVVDRAGRPWLVDPAPYGGHREIDLAMMRLFGGFGRRSFAAYDEAFPLSEGHEARVALYQLYPLLVHTLLFGGGYAHQAMAALHRCV
jgi:fructosamine-3-kinase